MEGIPTRMGDGSLVRMTRAEIEADIHAGVEAGVKRAKVEPLGADEIDHLVDVFASSARFSAVDIGDEVILTSDGVGSQDTGSRITDLQNYEQTVCTDTVELYHHDYSFKPIKPVLPFEQETMRQAQLLLTIPVRVRGDARPGALHGARRPHPQLVAAAAAGPHRRSACGPGRGSGGRRRRHRLRRRGHVRGRRRRHQPGHGGGGRRRRLPGRPQGHRAHPRQVPRLGHPDRHGQRVRARHARRARVRRRAPGRAVAGGPDAPRGQGRRLHLRARPSTSTRARRSPGTWRARAPSSSRAPTPPRSPSTSTGGWASAASPCTRCRRSTPSRAPREPASTSCGWTACRSAPATTTARGSATVSRREWADCGPPEIWWPACR